jgi:hypothetical protein
VGALVPPFNVVVFTSMPINLDSGTIRLIDGSGVGGPAIPIPLGNLQTGGSPLVSPGTQTTLTLSPDVACPTTLPATVIVTLTGVDLNGTVHAATNGGLVIHAASNLD